MYKQLATTYINLRSYVHANEFFYVIWGILLIFLTSQISIPLKPVPITLQTFGIMLIGLTFDRSAAIKAVTGYLMLGAMGVPVFSNFNGGYHYLLGPTAGYCMGFLLSVIVMTTFRRIVKHQNLFCITINCLIGTIITLSCGVTRLSYLIGFKAAIQSGFMPFIVPGIIKAMLLVATVRYLKLGRD